MASKVQEYAANATKFEADGKYLEASKEYQKILDVQEIAEVYLNKGVCLSAAARDSEAMKCFEKAVELKPELASAHCNLANIYKSVKRSKDAIESYKKAIELKPDLQTAHFGLAHCYNEIEDYDMAVKAAGESIKLAGKKLHIPSHNERVFALIKLQKPEEAIKDVDVITKGKEAKDLDAGARKLYAMVLSQEAVELTANDKIAKALDFHKRAAKMDGSFKNLFNLAISQIQNDKRDDALKSLNDAKKVDSSNWKVYAALGTVRMQKQEYTESAENFTKAATFPEAKDDETVNFNAGVSLMNIGKEDEALKFLETASKVNADNWTAAALLGSILINKDEYKKAENYLERASKTGKGAKDNTVWYNLGYAKLMLNNPAAASEAFKTALKIDPDSKQAKAAVEALESNTDALKASLAKLDDAEKQEKIKAANFADGEEGDLERAKILIAPQRPNYLRRKSLEHIAVGTVAELAGMFSSKIKANKAKMV